jgi:single-strand DNA-binding protein
MTLFIPSPAMLQGLDGLKMNLSIILKSLGVRKKPEQRILKSLFLRSFYQMGNVNKVILVGRLGQDPEVRQTPQGNAVANVSLATTERFKDKSGQQQEKAEWHRLVFWNRQAEIVRDYCKKGSQIYVEGSLATREWQDKEGGKRYTTEVVIRNLQLLDPKPLGGSGGGQQYQQAPGGPTGQTGPIDDVPF